MGCCRRAGAVVSPRHGLAPPWEAVAPLVEAVPRAAQAMVAPPLRRWPLRGPNLAGFLAERRRRREALARHRAGGTSPPPRRPRSGTRWRSRAYLNAAGGPSAAGAVARCLESPEPAAGPLGHRARPRPPPVLERGQAQRPSRTAGVAAGPNSAATIGPEPVAAPLEAARPLCWAVVPPSRSPRPPPLFLHAAAKANSMGTCRRRCAARLRAGRCCGPSREQPRAPARRR